MWSKVWVRGCLPAGIVGLNPTAFMDVCFFVTVVCCQVEVSAMGLSLIQRSPTKCGVSNWILSQHLCDEAYAN